jgi:hypothetical protein
MAALRRASADPVPDHPAHEHDLQRRLGALRAPGWEQRLAPLAQHMAAISGLPAQPMDRSP